MKQGAGLRPGRTKQQSTSTRQGGRDGLVFRASRPAFGPP